MAIKIDEQLLAELDLGDLPAAEKPALIKQIIETLEMRVGMKIAGELSDAQLKEFEQFLDKKDEAGAMAWLGKNYPDYKRVVSGELAKLKAEVKADAAQIKRAISENQ